MTLSPTAQPSPAAASAGAQASPKRSLLLRLLTVSIVAYSLGIFLLWIWLYLEADHSWLATMFSFGPRWVCGLPMLLLVPLAAVWRRRWLGLLAIAGIVIVMPVMGFRLNFASGSAPYDLRVLSCNVNQMNIRIEEFSDLIEQLQPDIVALQEVPYNPPPIAWPRGWHAVQFDKMIVASRFPVERTDSVNRPTQQNKPLAGRFTIKTPERDLQFFNVHMTTPRGGFKAVLDRRQGLDLSGIPAMNEAILVRTNEALVVSGWIHSFAGEKIIAGDFNTPVESVIWRQTWGAFEDAFGSAGVGLGYTKQTGRGMLTYGTRIDHILFTPEWRCVRSWVAADIGSDHMPLLADLEYLATEPLSPRP